MFKVGKHEFIIRQPEQIYDREACEFVNSREECDEPHYMYYSDISDIRVEEVHPCKFNHILTWQLVPSVLILFVRTFNSFETEELEQVGASVQQRKECVRPVEARYAKDD